MSEYISISEYAKRTGTTRQTVYRHMESDLAPFVVNVGGRKYLLLEALEASHDHPNGNHTHCNENHTECNANHTPEAENHTLCNEENHTECNNHTPCNTENHTECNASFTEFNSVTTPQNDEIIELLRQQLSDQREEIKFLREQLKTATDTLHNQQIVTTRLLAAASDHAEQANQEPAQGDYMETDIIERQSPPRKFTFAERMRALFRGSL